MVQRENHCMLSTSHSPWAHDKHFMKCLVKYYIFMTQPTRKVSTQPTVSVIRSSLIEYLN